MNTKYPGISTPVVVAVILGILTYVIILNLNRIMVTMDWILSGPRQLLVRKLVNEAPKVNPTGSGDQATITEPADWPARAKDF